MNAAFQLKTSVLLISMACVISQIAYAEEDIQYLADNVHQLPVIVVTAEQQSNISDGQVSQHSQIGMLGEKAVLDIPFSITSYTAKYIEDQQAHSIADALQNEPSVRSVFSGNGLGEYFNIRGFYTQSHELAWNGLFGLVPHNRVPTEFLERVEVFRGTSALLNGMSLGGAVGGVINVVPKRATIDPLTRLTTTISSESNLGVHLDLGRRFGEQAEYGIRINALKSQGNTVIDDQEEDRYLGSIALDYNGENLKASLDIYDIKEELTGGMPLMVSFASAHVPKAPDSTMNTILGSYGNTETKAVIANIAYDFTSNWTGYLTAGTKRQKGYGYIANNALGMNAQANGDYLAVSRVTANNTDVDAVEGGVRGNFQTAKINHQIVLSANMIDQETKMGLVTGTSWASNIYHPVISPNGLADRPTFIPTTSDTTLSSIALADTLSFLEDQYQLILGLRYQKIKSQNYNIFTGLKSGNAYDEDAVTPAVGFVMKPWKDSFAIYANYMEGLSQGDQAGVDAVNVGEIFSPYKSKQYEFGMKWENGSFRNTLSFYQITKPSLIKTASGIAATPADQKYIYSTDGEQRNRGIEWTTAGDILDHLRLLGGIAYMDAIQNKTVNGLLNGNDVAGIPHWQSNLGLELDITSIEGLTLTANGIYTGSMYVNDVNTQKLPSWTELNLGGRYLTSIADRKVIFRGGIDNVFDEQHWAGVWNGYAAVGGTPRSYKLSMQIDF